LGGGGEKLSRSQKRKNPKRERSTGRWGGLLGGSRVELMGGLESRKVKKKKKDKGRKKQESLEEEPKGGYGGNSETYRGMLGSF